MRTKDDCLLTATVQDTSLPAFFGKGYKKAFSLMLILKKTVLWHS